MTQLLDGFDSAAHGWHGMSLRDTKTCTAEMLRLGGSGV